MDSGDQEHLSCNSRQRQSKINAQAAEIASMKSELNKALQENKRLKSLFSPEKMVEAMTKAVSAMTMQSHPTPTPTSSKGTQYQGPQVLLAGLGHPNWHVVPMGHCCLV